MTTVLITVLSCKAYPFDRLMQAQQRTWDSVQWPGVSTVFYLGDAPEDKWEGNVLHLAINDNYEWMLSKFAKAIEHVLDRNWDIMFRTNASSYVCKRKLTEVASKLPKTKLYGGVAGPTSGGRTHVGGSGIFFSRDVVELLNANIKRPSHFTSVVEDGEMGHIMEDLNIPITQIHSRCEYYQLGKIPDVHHYRCKPAHPREDREDEIKAFDLIHKFKLPLLK